MTRLYSVYHLNLAFSSIEEEQRAEVVARCYWPLLRTIEKAGTPSGIECTGYTLECIKEIDPEWISTFHRLISEGLCELIGSGYCQIIGPLVPAKLNAKNIKIGNEVYQDLLGVQPVLALVNEQCYSQGILELYAEANYRGIFMEWENPSLHHPDWPKSLRGHPQIAVMANTNELPVIWNHTVAFQKFQRLVHGDISHKEYWAYFNEAVKAAECLCVYGNDVEIFDFRPGRFNTEVALPKDSEWQVVEQLLKKMSVMESCEFVLPSSLLPLAEEVGSKLSLQAPSMPIPTKKQGKYNVLRWAVTGRDDVGINTRCQRIFQTLIESENSSDSDWRELCFLWSSDFRTHITTSRWENYNLRLRAMENRLVLQSTASLLSGQKKARIINPPSAQERLLSIKTDSLGVLLNKRRGLAIERMWTKNAEDDWLCGTISHGFYDDILKTSDFYSANLVFQEPGRAQVTDLSPVSFTNIDDPQNPYVEIQGITNTPIGPVQKRFRVYRQEPRIDVVIQCDWPELPLGLLRMGFLTINPEGFERSSLYFETHNGGRDLERFELDQHVDYGTAISYLVSATTAVGMTEGVIRIGDRNRALEVQFDKSQLSVVGLVSCHESGSSYLCRLAFTATEVDDTVRMSDAPYRLSVPLCFSYSIRVDQ